jgi:hypothetical protein
MIWFIKLGSQMYELMFGLLTEQQQADVELGLVEAVRPRLQPCSCIWG